MSFPDPFAELAGWPHISLWFRDLGPNRHGATDGVENTWLHNRLCQVERRSSQAHENEHIRRGHTGCVPGSEEDRVRFAAAKWLVPDPHRVADALIWAGHDKVLAADHLWITVPTLVARLDRRYMHPAERALIDRKVGEELHP